MVNGLIKGAIVLTFLIGGAEATFAQEFSITYHDCIKRARTQFDVTVCTGDEGKRVERQLSERFGALTAVVANNPLAAAKIREMQSAWVAYRDAFIEAMFPAEDKQAEYGSSFSSEVSRLRIKLAQRQLAAVEELIIQHGPAK